jgi:Fe2+ or Zn2+ uptake regulation protein
MASQEELILQALSDMAADPAMCGCVEFTAKQIGWRLDDDGTPIPQATLYRTLKRMAHLGVLTAQRHSWNQGAYSDRPISSVYYSDNTSFITDECVGLRRSTTG